MPLQASNPSSNPQAPLVINLTRLLDAASVDLAKIEAYEIFAAKFA
jgi:hypothetical protein